MNKSPGVIAIGVGQVLQSIIDRAYYDIVKARKLNGNGYQQLCKGLETGFEVAVHAVVNLFEEERRHGFIKIYANYTFNSIN